MKYYLSVKSISKKYDVSEETIRGWIKRHKDLEVIKVFGGIKISKISLNRHIKTINVGNGVYKNEQKRFEMTKIG